jgi:energy-coupling factor transporter ATP-binding protein EcfA2
MITSLSIRDFQSIRSLDAECGLITVFYGESDAGKSAIVRALRGLAFNDWPADHVTEGRVASHVGVKVAVAGEGEFLVGARKGSGANEYLLEAPTGDRQEYGRVGRGVPEAVVELLGWREMELDDGTRFTPSFLAQFDEPFLVGTSPIKAAKILGGLTNIATLYAAIRDGANEERQARRGAEEAQLRVGGRTGSCGGRERSTGC